MNIDSTAGSTEYDIVICGGGPVGLAVAALLAHFGVAPHTIALIDAKSIDEAARDPRSLALSFGSGQILEEIGAWPIAADAIHQIHVSRRGHLGRALIDRDDYKLPALGYVTRYGELARALSAAVQASRVIEWRPARVCAVAEDADRATVTLADGRTLRANVVIQAEGGVFAEQGARTLNRDYDQVALVTHIQADAVLPQRAFERFTAEGPLALLPQEGGYAVVWCMRPVSAEQILALDDAAFVHALQEAFGERVGVFSNPAVRRAYPLGLNAHPRPSARTIAIGNAAQTLHPVAGQGLNLGLRDARVLARLLAARQAGDPEALPTALRTFAQTRRGDRNATIHLTDVMARIFAGSADDGPAQSLLGMSLGLIDLLSPARHALAGQMMFGRR